MPRLQKYISEAILCGPIPKIRNWKTLDVAKLTTGEKVLRFAADYLIFPEGKLAGKPLVLDPFQQAFILSVFHEKPFQRKGIFSVARRAGKTLLMAVILLAYIIGPLARENTLVRSAAMTRDQAGVLWRLMFLICQMSPEVSGLYRGIPSTKMLVGVRRNVEYRALSRDAKSGHGQGIYVLVLDEAGQIEASNDDFLDMLFSSMGTYEDSKTFIISTQAPSDASFLSIEIDSAKRDQPKDVTVHVYTAPTDELSSKTNWYAANPSLHGGYRSLEDIAQNADEARRIPAKQNGFLNLFLNRRVSLQRIWLAPRIWKENSGDSSLDVFREFGVSLGLDLSQKNDLTVGVITAIDANNVLHVKPFAFTPMEGVEERSRRDKVPYDVWVRDGILHGVPGATIDYEFVAQFFLVHLIDEGIAINNVEFDRWRINEFKSACERIGLPTMEFNEVGQGYRDISPRMEALETALLQKRVLHGNHPVLNLGASSAVVVSDPAGNRKMDKVKSAQKIDAMVALVMSAYPLLSEPPSDDDISWWIA